MSFSIFKHFYITRPLVGSFLLRWWCMFKAAPTQMIVYRYLRVIFSRSLASTTAMNPPRSLFFPRYHFLIYLVMRSFHTPYFLTNTDRLPSVVSLFILPFPKLASGTLIQTTILIVLLAFVSCCSHFIQFMSSFTSFSVASPFLVLNSRATGTTRNFFHTELIEHDVEQSFIYLFHSPIIIQLFPLLSLSMLTVTL